MAAQSSLRTYGSRSCRSNKQCSNDTPTGPAPTVPLRRKCVNVNGYASATHALKKQVKKHKVPPFRPKDLIQLHFNLDTPLVRDCPICDLTYTRGASEDETLHRAYCTKVQKGLEWKKEEGRAVDKITDIGQVVRMPLLGGKQGRIIAVQPDVGGRVGSKVKGLLKLVDLALSSPPLSPDALQESKVYIFLIRLPSGSTEHIAGCAVAQRILTAMAIADSSQRTMIEKDGLIEVDHSLGLYCHPQPLPTHMGVSRLFVSSSYRRLGIARALLDAAAKTFMYGCHLDPTLGQVAFSQPTGLGRAVMDSWGMGGIRIFRD